MKNISLTRGLFCIVDESDYEELCKFKWHSLHAKGCFYAARKVKNKIILMHRQLIGAKKGEIVDHINGDKMDNRRCNLRVCNGSQNQMNRKLTHNSKSGFKGVTWFGRDGKWRSYITHKRKFIHIGYFNSKEDAALSYDNMARQLFGAFAKLNFG